LDVAPWLTAKAVVAHAGGWPWAAAHMVSVLEVAAVAAEALAEAIRVEAQAALAALAGAPRLDRRLLSAAARRNLHSFQLPVRMATALAATIDLASVSGASVTTATANATPCLPTGCSARSS
jgi:hypothetical protein